MSRYTKDVSKQYSIAYGFDHASGYFFQKFNELAEEEELVINECSTFSGLSNGHMINLMEEYKVNPSHIQMVMYDLPF